MTRQVKFERISEAYKKNYIFWLIYATRLFKDVEFAKEVVQQSVYEALIWGGHHSDDINYGAYITKIIKLIGYAHLKKHKRREEIAQESMVGVQLYDEYKPHDASILDIALMKLKPAYSEVIKLRYIEELQAVEIAERLGTTKNSIDKKISRAYEVIREFIRTGIFVNRNQSDGRPVSQETIKVFELRTSGLSVANVAAMLDISEKQVSERYCTYLKRLRK